MLINGFDVDIQRKNFDYNFTVNNGFHDVIYNADGTNPKYDNSAPFSITVTTTVPKEDGTEEAHSVANLIIKNTYRTLMTRGQKGCYIYCTDKKLAKYLKRRLNQN